MAAVRAVDGDMKMCVPKLLSQRKHNEMYLPTIIPNRKNDDEVGIRFTPLCTDQETIEAVFGPVLMLARLVQESIMGDINRQLAKERMESNE